MKENTLKHIKKLEYPMIVLSDKLIIIISIYLIIYIRINFYWGGTSGGTWREVPSCTSSSPQVGRYLRGVHDRTVYGSLFSTPRSLFGNHFGALIPWVG